MNKKFLKKLKAAGWSPHRGQLEYLMNKSRFRVLACGRRWGKTDAAAADMASLFLFKKPTKQLAIAPTIAQAKIVFHRIVWMLMACGLTCFSTTSPHPTIRMHEGDNRKAPVIHVLDARSGHDANHLRGMGAHNILVDEAGFVPESLVQDVVMPMLAATNGKMTLISTPNGKNFFYKFFQMGMNSENEFWSRHSPSEENPRVNKKFLEIQKNILPERTYAVEYEAQFLEALSNVFSFESIDNAMNLPMVNEGFVVAGIDWGRYKDYTALAAVRGNNEHSDVFYLERWRQLPWAHQLERLRYALNDIGADIVICDSTGAGQPATEHLQSEIPNIPVINYSFTQESKIKIIENLRWSLEKQKVRLPAHPILLKELENYQAEVSDIGNVKYGAGNGYHDDLVCALALACYHLPPSARSYILGKQREEIGELF